MNSTNPTDLADAVAGLFLSDETTKDQSYEKGKGRDHTRSMNTSLRSDPDDSDDGHQELSDSHSDGYPPPSPVTDESGDPLGLYYIPPPFPGAVGRHWVVWKGLTPGIYDNWPRAQSCVDGISYASHRAYGNPRLAWEAYEKARTANMVHRLPYVPPNLAPPQNSPDTPASRMHPNTQTRPNTYTRPNTTSPSSSGTSCVAPYAASPSPCSSVYRTAQSSPGNRAAQDASAISHATPYPASLSPHSTAYRTTQSLSGNQTVRKASAVVQSSSAGAHPTCVPTSPVQATPASRALSSTGAGRISLPISPVQATPTARALSSTGAGRISLPTSPTRTIYAKTRQSSSVGGHLSLHSDTTNDDPWKGEAEGYVVFQGSVPGVYRHWEDCKCFTRDCIGAIYRGYSSWTEAVEAYMDAVNKGTTKVLPLVVIQEEESADNGL